MKLHRTDTDLTQGVVWKRLLTFFLPIAAGTCIQQLYNAVDGLIVGRFVGTVALAAVGGSSAQIINLLIGFFVAMTAGASVVVAQIYGAGRREDVGAAAGSALVLFALLGVVLMGVGVVLASWMLRLLNTPEDTMEAAVTYLRIYFLGVPFILILNMESNLLRSVGDSVSPFLFMVVGCVSNIALDVVFVLVFHWGVAGVAIATAAAQVINMLLLSHKLLHTDSVCRPSFRSLSLRGGYLRSMLRLGLPAGMQNAMYGVSNMIVQVGVNSLGTVVVASWAMTSKTDGVYWAVSNALGAAITSFVGQNLGASKPERVRQCVKQGMLLHWIITLGVSGGILLLAKPLLHLLTTDTAVIDTTWQMMLYFVPFYWIWSVIEVLSGVLRGAGDAVRPVIIIGVCICLLRIVWIFTLFRWVPTLPVLCWCYAVSWAVAAAGLFLHFRRGKWQEKSRMVLHK